MSIFGRNKDEEYIRAARLLTEGRPKEAAELLKSILAREPKNFNAMVTLAIALLDGQQTPTSDHIDTQRALTLLDNAAQLRPRDPVPHFNKGVCLRKLGRLEDALRSFQRALELDSKSALTLLHMAELNYELQRWREAIEFARKAIVRDPGLENALTWVPEVVERIREENRRDEQRTDINGN